MVGAGCAHHAGKQAGRGAVQGTLEELRQLPLAQEGRLMETLARKATAGAMEEISLPENQARIAAIVELVTRRTLHALAVPGAMAGAPAGAAPQGAPAADGADALERIAARAGSAAAIAALAELAKRPDLLAPVASQAGRSAAEGARSELRMAVGLAGFGGGVLATLLILALARLVRARRGGAVFRRRDRV
jgi:hypothetical protein